MPKPEYLAHCTIWSIGGCARNTLAWNGICGHDLLPRRRYRYLHRHNRDRGFRRCRNVEDAVVTPSIAVYTHTAYVPIGLIEAWAKAAQVALSRDFAPHWGDARLRFVPPGGAIGYDEWQLVFFDHSDQAGALGYHETTSMGHPIGKVFLRDCIADRENWNVTALHEVYEMIADPQIDQTVRVTIDGVEWEYCREVCDAPEDDRFGQRVGGHLASNFVLPSWFDPAGVAPFTGYPCLEITAPFMLASGGYIGRRVVGGEWQQQ